MKITFFCGPSAESWSPKSISSGIGGSEEMVINLAKELAKKHDVKVWNRCSQDAGTYDGVVYENYEDYEIEPTDILVVWRSPSLLTKFGLDKLQAKKYLWLHDLMNPLDVVPYSLGFDKFLTVSKWHNDYYEGWIPPSFRKMFFPTRNAVDYSLFSQKVERIPKKIVYGSMYNRGLIELLNMWPKIKMEVPEATLSVFYGYETLQKLMGVDEFKAFKDELEELFAQDGITHLGRISQEEVAREYLSASIWAYPCINFNEVSCISAMKAQIGGAIPVVIPKAALDETVRYGVKVRHGKNAGEILDNYSNRLISVLNDEKAQEQVRKVMIQGVKGQFDYKSLAKSWEEMWKK